MKHNNKNEEEYLAANFLGTAGIKINNHENYDESSDKSLTPSESSQNNFETPNEEEKFDHSYSTPSWLQHLSYGGLTELTANRVEKAKVFENTFKKFHMDKINPDANNVKRLTKLTKKNIMTYLKILLNHLSFKELILE